MVNRNQVVTLLSNYEENVAECIKRAKVYVDLEGCILGGNESGAKYALGQISSALAEAAPVGYEIPRITMYSTFTENEEGAITVVGLTLSSNYKSDYSFSFKASFPAQEGIEDVLITYMSSVYAELLEDVILKENVALVNETLAAIGEKAGLTYKVSFVTPMTHKGKKLVSISDDEVVFVADIDNMKDLEKLILFAEETEVLTAKIKEETFENAVAQFAQAQTTVQFVALHEATIGYLANLGKLVKAATLIKKTVSKNIEKVRGSKDTLAYYKDGDIYAIVSVTSAGNALVLSPFNVNTLESVDFDVLAAI